MLTRSVLEIMDDMVKNDNKGITMSNILTDVVYNSQGAKISFGMDESFGKQAEAERDSKSSEYMFMCFAVKKSELIKYAEENHQLN